MPGKGIGIESVQPGTPAAQAQLAQGMVIQKINGVEIVDEASAKQAMASSNGMLNMTVLTSSDAPPQEVSVQMTRVAATSF